MDKYGHIYMDESPPVEDKARLEGYLIARAEADKKKRKNSKKKRKHGRPR